MQHFWIKFALRETLVFVGAYLSATGLTEAQKAAIQKIVDATQEALLIF